MLKIARNSMNCRISRCITGPADSVTGRLAEVRKKEKKKGDDWSQARGVWHAMPASGGQSRSGRRGRPFQPSRHPQLLSSRHREVNFCLGLAAILSHSRSVSKNVHRLKSPNPRCFAIGQPRTATGHCDYAPTKRDGFAFES